MSDGDAKYRKLATEYAKVKTQSTSRQHLTDQGVIQQKITPCTDQVSAALLQIINYDIRLS